MIHIAGRHGVRLRGGGTMRDTAPSLDEAAAPADDAAWRNGLAQTLTRLGLNSSARLLVETARPMSWLGAQLLWVAQPTLALFGAGARVARLAQTLESDQAVGALARALDTPSPEEPRHSAPGL
jgi:hypothetical protein